MVKMSVKAEKKHGVANSGLVPWIKQNKCMGWLRTRSVVKDDTWDMINGVEKEYKRNERSVFYGIADVADISRKRQLWTWCARVKNSEGAAMPSRGDRRRR